MAGADEAELKEVVFFTGSCVYVYTVYYFSQLSHGIIIMSGGAHDGGMLQS